MDMDLVCWDWMSGSELFKVSNAHIPAKNRVTCIEMRTDVPMVVGGFRNGHMCVWSLRRGSCGKVCMYMNAYLCMFIFVHEVARVL